MRFPHISWSLAVNVLLPYRITVIFSMVTTSDRHPLFWYLHAGIVISLLVLVVVFSSFTRK